MKVLLLEKTNLMKLRIQKIIARIGTITLKTFNEQVLSFDQFYDMEKPFDVVLIDTDVFTDYKEALLAPINQRGPEGKPRLIAMSTKVDMTATKDLFYAGFDDVIAMPFYDETIVQKLMMKKSQKQDTVLKDVLTSNKTPLEWSSDYEIGIPDIDEEHKSIFYTFKHLYEQIKAGTGHDDYPALINFLNNYVDVHFAHEEAFQKEIGYEGFDDHQQIHENFKSSVHKLVESTKTQKASNLDLIKLNLFVKEWILHHILIEDARFSAFYKSKQ